MTVETLVAPAPKRRVRPASLPLQVFVAPPTVRFETEDAPLPAFPTGDAFSAHKILVHFDRLKAVAEGKPAYPITVEIDPTNVCNHRCQWCVSAMAHNAAQLPDERFASLVAELQACDVRSVVLKGGGEPTVHPDFPQLLATLRASGLAVGLITNGSMPRAGTTEEIRRSCQWVRVSLDAATADTHALIHGTRDFAKVVRNVEALVGGETVVGINFVAEPRNFHEMADVARLGKRLGVAYVTIRCVFDPNQPMTADVRDAMRAGASAAKAEQQPGFNVFLGNFTEQYLNASGAQPFPYARCLGPNLVGVVGGDGEVYACCFLRGDKRFSFGSVHEQGFAEIWNGARRQQVMRDIYRGGCGRACAGGMTANRYNTYNEILNYLAAEDKRHAEFA